MTNPCLKCKNKDIDKNNPECKECSLRVQYVKSIGPMTCSSAFETGFVETGLKPVSTTKTGDKNIMENIKEKRCPGCGEKFPATAEYFQANKRAKDGLQGYCKACRSIQAKESKKSRKKTAINSAANDKLFNDPIVFPPNNNILISFDDYPEILEKIITAAKAEFRRPEQQILFELNKAQE